GGCFACSRRRGAALQARHRRDRTLPATVGDLEGVPRDRGQSMKPLVSVMMPVLDPHPVYFRAAVESVLAQTLTDLELVIVEDPGRSSGAEILSGIADPRIRHICNPKRTSLVDQRNRALAEARADFVAMLDADDIAKPERLQKQYDYLQAYPNVDVLGTQLFIIDESGKQLGFRSYPLKHAQIVAAMH